MVFISSVSVRVLKCIYVRFFGFHCSRSPLCSLSGVAPSFSLLVSLSLSHCPSLPPLSPCLSLTQCSSPPLSFLSSLSLTPPPLSVSHTLPCSLLLSPSLSRCLSLPLPTPLSQSVSLVASFCSRSLSLSPTHTLSLSLSLTHTHTLSLSLTSLPHRTPSLSLSLSWSLSLPLSLSLSQAKARATHINVACIQLHSLIAP